MDGWEGEEDGLRGGIGLVIGFGFVGIDGPEIVWLRATTS